MKAFLPAVSSLLLALPVMAQPRPRHGPPQEAIQACASSTKGASCSFEHRGHSVTGTCENPPQGDGLACRPAHPPGGPGHHHGPPPEAIEACKSLAENAACTVKLPDRTVEGVCRKGPHGEVNACAPKDGPPPPPAGDEGPAQK